RRSPWPACRDETPSRSRRRRGSGRMAALRDETESANERERRPCRLRRASERDRGEAALIGRGRGCRLAPDRARGPALERLPPPPSRRAAQRSSAHGRGASVDRRSDDGGEHGSIGRTLVKQADTLLVNGNVITVDDRFTRANAVALRDGQILAVGGADV